MSVGEQYPNPATGVVVQCDHLPAFSVNPPGALVLRRHQEGNVVWLTTITADSQVEFSDELLRDFAGGGDNDGMYPDVEVSPNYQHCMSECRLDGKCFNGWLIRIHACDRTVVYRIGEYAPARNSWVARWPD